MTNIETLNETELIQLIIQVGNHGMIEKIPFLDRLPALCNLYYLFSLPKVIEVMQKDQALRTTVHQMGIEHLQGLENLLITDPSIIEKCPQLKSLIFNIGALIALVGTDIKKLEP
jgi:hypothetical protein